MPRQAVDEAKASLGLPDFSRANIREIVSVANKVEAATGLKYVRMEMGVPGLPPDAIGTEAEIEALRCGCAARYPMLDGLPALKEAAARFVKAFTDVDVEPRCCIPVSGSMQGAFATFLTLYHAMPERGTVLFIDPGFPVQKTQLDIIGLRHEAFDIHHTRGRRTRSAGPCLTRWRPASATGTSRPCSSPTRTTRHGCACAMTRSGDWPPLRTSMTW